jgi:D-3-phosphoglycerate dehydrogenase
MLGMQSQFVPLLHKYGVQANCPDVVQVMSEDELIRLLPSFDGWIIGDDPATRRVFEAGRSGKLKAAVKWGVGTDNVDFNACEDLGIPIDNTPGMFGEEVSDVALGYIIGLARETYFVDREVRKGLWPKPRGVSLAGKTIGLVGYGDIGSRAAAKFQMSGMQVIVFDKGRSRAGADGLEFADWPSNLERCDFLVFTCSLNGDNHHMLNEEAFRFVKAGVRIVNVSRGALIDEVALCMALESGHVHSVALDVFEVEPLPADSNLRRQERCVFGSHNASNTADAVERTNCLAIEKLMGFLGRTKS